LRGFALQIWDNRSFKLEADASFRKMITTRVMTGAAEI
jgi:hypothetical protein